MKKLAFFAVAIAAMAFTACGGNKSTRPAEDADSVKSFEQQQVEAKIKVELDSLAAALSQLKQLPIIQGEDGLKLTDQEKQVKPEYLLAPTAAENAATLPEKYRMLSALSVDKKIAELYDLPTDEYQKAISKLVADLNDPSFKSIEDAGSIFETSQALYTAMDENGRINFFWQLAAASFVEQLYVISQNTDKFLAAFDDDAAANVTYRIVLLIDAINRLTEYDTEIKPVAEAIAPLDVLNAISVEQLKSQIAEANEKIKTARAALFQ